MNERQASLSSVKFKISIKNFKGKGSLMVDNKFDVKCNESTSVFRFISGLCIVSMLNGCSLFPTAPSLSEPPLVYIWPRAQCPSDPLPKTYAETHKPGEEVVLPIILGALGSVALGQATSALFGIPAQFLQQAVKADQNGFSASSVNARYYYTDITDKTDPKFTNKLNFSPPGCYVVAVYKTPEIQTKTKTSWCDDDDFKKAVPNTCTNGKSTLDNDLKLIEPLPRTLFETIASKDDNSSSTLNIKKPDLYLEIAFDEISEVEAEMSQPKSANQNQLPVGKAAGIVQPEAVATPSPPPSSPTNQDSNVIADPKSVKASIVLPKLKQIFYPNSLLSKWSNEKRSLTIGITLSQIATYLKNAKAKDGDQSLNVQTNQAEQLGLLNVNFLLTLNAETPDKPVAKSLLAPYPKTWTLIPALHDMQIIKLPDSGQIDEAVNALNRVPVNVQVNVHEAGAPNIFLAALANASQSSVSDYSKAIVSAVLPPPGTQTTQQLIQKNQASVSSAAATYQKDASAFWKECKSLTSKPSGSESGYLNSLWGLAYQDYQYANQTATSYGVSSGIESQPINSATPQCPGS